MAAEKVEHSNYVPAQLERHLEFMQQNTVGHAILGCSNLTGRFWIGSLWYYRNPEEGPSVEKALTGVDFENGLVDGFFIDDKNIIVAEDNGAVEHVRLTFNEENSSEKSSFFYLDRVRSMLEHDDLISSIVKTSDNSRIITASFDKSIVVSETDSFKLLSKTSDAHTDIIHSIAIPDAKSTNILTSAGNDGIVSIWDLRALKDSNASQTCIYENMNAKPSCLQFLPESENILLIGNYAGEIEAHDLRKPKECLAKNKNPTFKTVTKIKFSHQNPRNHLTTFAVCFEDVTVQAYEFDSTAMTLTQKYENSSHEDYARDILWTQDGSSNKFYSCGWDHKVICHNF